MENKEIYQDKEGRLYFVEYDGNGEPYQVFCDEEGNPLVEEEVVEPVYVSPVKTEPTPSPVYAAPVVQNKKSNKGLIALLAAVLLLLMCTGGYFVYTKFFAAKPTVDISNYEVNFVAYGTEGEGKPSVDIQKIPVTENAKENEAAIDELLKKPKISFDKDGNLKNGDKVEVTIDINANSAKKYNLDVVGEFKKVYTVNGLTHKPEEKVIIKEKENSSSSSNSGDISKKDERVRYVVPSAGLNLREEPNDSSRIITTARQGNGVSQKFTRTTSNGEVWARVSYNGYEGWMRADYLS